MTEEFVAGPVEVASEHSTHSLRFHPVSLTRAHEEVVDQIVYAIRSGLLTPGTRLPTIEELASMTSVSKPVIGEAVKLLREHGVLETKRGVQGGVTVVSDQIPTSLMRLATGWREATLTELVEARRPIELELALLAGERATPEDFQAMHTSLSKLREAHGKGSKGSFLRFDHLFHYQIGLAARSEKLAYYQHRVLSEIAATLYDYELFHEDRDLVITTHEAMLDALEKRDPDSIRAAVDAHWRTSSGAFADVDEIA
jgi:GntR family transcriptional repressor for pyruvate dehydrogenase complex